MKAYEQIAVAFSSALVSGDFETAHALLAPPLRDELAPQALRKELHTMFEGYADGAPTHIDFNDEFSLDDWPEKQPQDVGWAYVSIIGDDFVEAVAVVVSDVEGDLLIRTIEWGRP